MTILSAVVRAVLPVVLAALTLAMPTASAAPAPQREPVLRIETASHLATITRISADAAGHWLVTASEDKTARIWDSRSGRLAGVLRPPIGGDSVGALYAAAISPDGRSVAVGGNSNFGDNSHLLHLFDRASATIPAKSTITGLEAPITQLAWSADNQLLAIGLRQEGLRVFRRNLQFLGADPEYNEAIFGADFAADGRLAVASLDGSIRLYRTARGSLERIARITAPGGKPYAVAFSPDGRTLAVGYQDRARVDLLDADSLNSRHRIDLGSGNLGRVAWSGDGNTLYAAGGYSNNGRFPVLAFANRGTAQGEEVASFSNTILSLAALPGHRIAAASAEPAWAVFDAQGHRLSGSSPQGVDFRDSDSHFRVNADASLIAFPYRAGEPSQVFDLNAGSLKAAAVPDTARPPLQSGSPAVGNWKNSTTPSINGRALSLKPGEVSRSLAIHPGDRSVVLGTEWFLRRYAADGTPLWERRVTAPAWAVNVSGDGRWIVAGLGDGSLRWFRSRDGVEQLAMFAHADRSRWIVWTPSGYYDTSVAGESLVGWHLNRAFNQSADFFSAGRFRDKLYRPDLIQKLLASGDEAEALRLIRAGQAGVPVAAVSAPGLVEIVPPIIELQSDSQLQASGDLVTVRYAVRTPANAPLKDIKVRVNGRLERSIKPATQRAIKGELPAQEIQVRVPPGKPAEIVLIAENRHAKSDPVSIRVSPAPTAVSAVATSALTSSKPDYDTLYMLIVAVNKYPGSNELISPVKDANAFKAQMDRVSHPPPGVRRIYNKLEVKMLTDENATREGIIQGLDWLKSQVGEKDAGILFLSGHGIAQDKSYYYVPYKAGAMAARPAEWLPGDLIVGTLQSLPGRAMFFLDTCYAGALTNQAASSRFTSATNATDMLNKIDDERGVIVFASSTGKEKSGEDDNNGFFTKALIEGLRGGAVDKDDSLVYPTLLKRYVTRRVRELSNNEQRPFISDHGIDEPIAVVIK